MNYERFADLHNSVIIEQERNCRQDSPRIVPGPSGLPSSLLGIIYSRNRCDSEDGARDPFLISIYLLE